DQVGILSENQRGTRLCFSLKVNTGTSSCQTISCQLALSVFGEISVITLPKQIPTSGPISGRPTERTAKSSVRSNTWIITGASGSKRYFSTSCAQLSSSSGSI